MSVGEKLAWVLGLSLVASISWASDVAILRNGYSIPHQSRTIIGSDTRLYISADGVSYVDVPTAEIDHIEENAAPDPQPAPPEKTASVAATPVPRSPAAIPQAAPVPAPAIMQDAVQDASSRYRLDPDLVNSVIRAESGFNPHAVSPKGARGLMQLMPQTASQLGVPNSFDPQANVDGGTRYLRELLERYNFDLIKALAAYNAGPQRVEQYGGVPPYRETRAYVARIVRDFNKKKLAQQKATAAPGQKAPQPGTSAGTSQPHRTASSTDPSASR